MKKFTKILLSLVLTMSLMIASSGIAFAADTTSTGTDSVEATVPVTGTVNALTISVTHPASVEYAINPNLGYAADAFVAPDIPITNNTPVPVSVTVETLASTAGGTIQFTDVLPAAQDWANLNTADSKTYIALGLKIADSTGWNTGYEDEAQYAVNISSKVFGVLDANATGKITMLANYGLAFDQSYSAMHSLVLLFNLV